jgi:putative salt-induced outer membrane protein
MSTRKRKALFLFVVLSMSISRSWADDAPATPPAKPWTNAGEFSLVSTNGNSKTSTTAAKDTYVYNWTNSVLQLIAGGLGSSSGGQQTAEQYNASEKMTRNLGSSDNYVFERFGWDSNRFAGYRDLYDASAGLGRTLLNLPKDKLIGELAPGYVNQQFIDAPRKEYAAGQAHAKYTHTLSATANFSQDVAYIEDFSDKKDYRLNTETAIIASLTTHLSLKASYTWHRVGEPPANIGKDDTITAVALIVNY